MIECFDDVWASMIAIQDTTTFHTARVLPYTYKISGGVVKLSRRANPITKATVRVAFDNAVKSHGAVPGPKALGCFGASYIYPIFAHLGVVEKAVTPSLTHGNVGQTAEEEKKLKGMSTMPRIKGSKNKVKSMTIDEQVTAAEERVAKLKEELQSAEAELNTLTTLRDEAAMKELAATIAASGKSFADVIAWIKNCSADTGAADDDGADVTADAETVETDAEDNMPTSAE